MLGSFLRLSAKPWRLAPGKSEQIPMYLSSHRHLQVPRPDHWKGADVKDSRV